MRPRLTELVKSGGCAAKIRPADLEELLGRLGLFRESIPEAVAGRESPDDAVVVRTPGGELMVQTLDFFPPVCDDPFLFGKIAAANALSDVYAMGGKPYTAMNICCFPLSTLGPEVLAEILKGGAAQVKAAEAIAAGGHTIEDAEPKYGLAVTGFVSEADLTTKTGAKPGDNLVLTKPVGTGVLNASVKKGWATAQDVEAAYCGMACLNDMACQEMNAAGVKSATDVTGYGLLGHSWEMVREQDVRFIFEASRLPVYDGARELAAKGACPGGSRANRQWLEDLGVISWDDGVDETSRILFTDAQTSGGLLMAWPKNRPIPKSMWRIGQVVHRNPEETFLRVEA